MILEECTIVIPALNPQPGLRRVVDRLMESGAHSIVVVDDGSSEQYHCTFDALERSGALVIHHVVNRGPAAARNTGIAASRTMYFCPLDADDDLDPRFITEGIKLLQANHQTAFAYCWAKLGGTMRGIMKFPEWSVPYLLARNISCCTAVVKRNVWEEVGGYTEAMTHGLEDWDLWLKFVEAGYQGRLIPEPLFTWNRSKDSRTDRMWAAGLAPAQYRNLVERHRALYEAHLPEVIAMLVHDAHIAEGGHLHQLAKLAYYRLIAPMARKLLR